eukprot:gnl/TRDRNA2_/TRDRNA2_196883_c0_seq1.p2 gnl/TRDRNA2_/TRDRNA2_196883_c0~~gnl/TRDRNA2_/TRDRNA2_196883_c0_seq1.p2  ORF type:complete len:182 (+),score=33.77 gnl/TRDRNA2_/TRDRNA2_196883_c0_seq1:279-824(+)
MKRRLMGDRQVPLQLRPKEALKSATSSSVAVVDDETTLAEHVRSEPLPARSVLDLPRTDPSAKMTTSFCPPPGIALPCASASEVAARKRARCESTGREQLMFSLEDVSSQAREKRDAMNAAAAARDEVAAARAAAASLEQSLWVTAGDNKDWLEALAMARNEPPPTLKRRVRAAAAEYVSD